MPQINYTVARDKLDETFQDVSETLTQKVEKYLVDCKEPLDIVFNSSTQSYKEALLGCALAHLLNPSIDIRLPYMKQGPNAYNGRTLDENVINPFFQDNLIPCSKGPYLATFRRSIKFIEDTRDGLKDKKGYDAMLNLISVIENIKNNEDAVSFLACLLYRFILLRDASHVALVRIKRLSINQYKVFLDRLFRCQSGGLLPVIATVALYQSINHEYGSNWDISWQGINTADGASGAGGDITIKKGDKSTLSIEVTERAIEQNRVKSTFNTKIILNDIRNYLFVYTYAQPAESARQIANMYFSQGYDIKFVNLIDMIINYFLIGDENTRIIFMDRFIDLLESKEVPSSVKTSWNNSLKSTIDYNLINQ